MRKVISMIACLVLVGPGFAQETPRVVLHLHGNSGSPPMLGVSYLVHDNIRVRTSGGYFRETWTACATPTGGACEDDVTNWYGAELATLYRFSERWRFAPYAGLGIQYLYATEKRGVTRERANRFEFGGLAGLDLRTIWRIGLSAEVGLGYHRGLDRNSGGLSIIDRTSASWGLNHVGIGLQVRL